MSDRREDIEGIIEAAKVIAGCTLDDFDATTIDVDEIEGFCEAIGEFAAPLNEVRTAAAAVRDKIAAIVEEERALAREGTPVSTPEN